MALEGSGRIDTAEIDAADERAGREVGGMPANVTIGEQKIGPVRHGVLPAVVAFVIGTDSCLVDQVRESEADRFPAA